MAKRNSMKIQTALVPVNSRPGQRTHCHSTSTAADAAPTRKIGFVLSAAAAADTPRYLVTLLEVDTPITEVLGSLDVTASPPLPALVAKWKGVATGHAAHTMAPSKTSAHRSPTPGRSVRRSG